MAIDPAEVKRRFTFHTASPAAIEQLEAVRQEFIKIGTALSYLPEGREKSLAFTNLEQAQFFANAAIVRPLAE